MRADAGRDGSGTACAPRHPCEPPDVGCGCSRRQGGDRGLSKAAGASEVESGLLVAHHASHTTDDALFHTHRCQIPDRTGKTSSRGGLRR